MENNIYNELEFLMNPELYQKYMDSKEKDISNNFIQDKRFYKKRIIQLTKDMFKDERDLPESLKQCFKSYLKNCILYLKVEDKTEIIQTEYNNLKKKQNVVTKDLDTTSLVNQADSTFLSKNIKDDTKTLDNYVIKKPLKKPSPKPPQKKIVNLKTPELKRKGLKKKKKKDIIN